MEQTPPFRLPAPLERAAQRVRRTARTAAEQAVDSLGLAAVAAGHLLQRDALLAAQYELSRKIVVFAQAFNEALDTEVARQAGVLTTSPRPGLTPELLVANWESLTLVEDCEVELHISAERLALAIAQACEWELREFDGYMATLLGLDAADHSRNPLRAEVVSQAMMRAIDVVSGRPEVRKVLATEIGRALAQGMRGCYGELVADLRATGLRPVGLVVRPSTARMATQPGPLTAPGDPATTTTSTSTSTTTTTTTTASTGFGGPHAGTMASATAPLAHAGPGTDHGSGPPSGLRARRGTPMGHVDPGMMGAIRRLARTPVADLGDPSGKAGASVDSAWASADAPAPVNVIANHRSELRQLATGSLDHLVIDLVAGLFDQILADAKVPPQFARQIARLQLPVLRAALGDPGFFASRRHPVRRFVNRIASLGTAVDSVEVEPGLGLLRRVGELVQAVVDGEFDQAEVYEQQLLALEAFVNDQAQAEVQALGDADAVLARKEGELLVQQQFAAQLDHALRGLPVPDYLREFVSQVWSRAIARVELKEGPASPLALRLRDTGRELVMSVQPKGSPGQRQQFLHQLPPLMKALNLGLDHARCPADVRRAFFTRLMPAHAEALKSAPLSTLDHNLLARQVAAALALPLPTADEVGRLSPSEAQALQAAANDQGFTPAEALAVGLVGEQAVDWHGALDIDLSAEPAITSVDIAIDGLPAPEPLEPMRGKPLADHLQIGLAYQMQLQNGWHQVRLAHVSTNRSFFLFTHGHKQRCTVAMTHRMLVRLCDAGRLRALENAYLLERATARARRQLAQLKPGHG